MLDKDFPRTQPEFQSRFRTEAACRAYLRKKRWPKGFRCPRCGESKAYSIETRRLEECALCHHQVSLTAGTLFHRTRKPLRLWFRAIFEFVSRKHGCNAMDYQRLFGLSRKVAWAWLHKIREAMVRPDRLPLAGSVEIDEAYVGGPEAGRPGRSRGKKALIIGAVESKGKACGRLRLGRVESARAKELQTWVRRNVSKRSKALTDGWPSYRGLSVDYEHLVVGKSGRVDRPSEVLRRIHLVFSLFKRLILGTYHGSVSNRHFDAYCQEFVFRFNRRRSRHRTKLFQRIIETAVLRAPTLGYSKIQPN